MVNVIAEHVEYQLRKHDCVVVPGFGAFLCNYVAAHFDERRKDVIVPPARHLAFNRMIVDSDGLLAWSVSRRDLISYEAATIRVGEAVEALWHELTVYGEATFGRLGTFYLSKTGEIEFVSAPLPSINGMLYGLQPLLLDPVGVDDSMCDVAGEDHTGNSPVVLPWGMRWRAYATGVVASLAVIITALLMVVSPIRLDREMQQASMAPVPKSVPEDMAEESASLQIDDMVQLGKCAWTFVADAEKIDVDASTPGEVADRLTDDVVQKGNITAPESEGAVEISGGDKHAGVGLRFNSEDAYCVVVASFPSRRQADLFVAENGSVRRLEILEKDSKFRIYAATGNSYAAADGQRRLVGQEDAWICRR